VRYRGEFISISFISSKFIGNLSKNKHMRSVFNCFAVFYILFLSCKSKPVNLSDQLKANLLTHIHKVDSTLVLDSFRIIRLDTANERLLSEIDDTLYKTVLARVRSQMANATKNNNTDSMAIYQYELDYMIPTSDSLTREISKSDTTKKFGLLVSCQIQVSRDNLIKTDKVYYFLDKDMKIWNGEWIDSAISRISRTVR
jgi:hypothetical protein